MYMEVKGQISAEFVMMAGFMLFVTCAVALFIGDANELTQAMAAARTGAGQGAVADSLAVYPDKTFSNYTEEHQGLLIQSGVKIVKIEWKDQGLNPVYNRTKIQLKIYASAPSVKSDDRDCMGERINFNARKSICETFNTQNLTNSFFNPAFSNKYVFTTCDVQWV